jgi:hypothetical protein
MILWFIVASYVVPSHCPPTLEALCDLPESCVLSPLDSPGQCETAEGADWTGSPILAPLSQGDKRRDGMARDRRINRIRAL